MKKNVGSQLIGVQMITAADGLAFTGAATALITIDGGTQAASGGTGPTHEGNGFYTYLPTQAETNGDHIGFTFTGTGAIPVTIQVYTMFPQTVDNATSIADIDSRTISTTAAANLELQYDGSGLTGDAFPATQAQVGNISSGSGGLSKIQDSFTNTDGGAETNTEADTETLNGLSHVIDDNAGNIDFYYEFDLGVNGAATAILWNGFIQSNGDSASPQMYNWAGASFENVAAPISGSNGTTVTEMSFPAPSKYTGTGANAGKVRFGFNSTDATAISTDRVLCVFSSIAQQALVFNEGVAQSGGNNSIQIAAGSVGTNDQFQRARVILSGGTGAGQEAIITASTASTDTLTITPAWLTNPDATTVYEIIPGQTHSTIRNGGYDNGYIYLDVVNGSSGTIIGVSGTTTNKSDNPADARTVADIENIRQFIVSGGGAWSLDQAYTFWIFNHVSASLITLNSQDITGSVFMRSGITGIGTGTSTSVFELCGMLDVTVDVCNFLQCGFEGTTTLTSTDQYLAWHCFENSSTTPIIDINGDGITATTLNLVGYSGRIEIKGMTSVDVVVVAGDVHLTVNVDCTGGTLTYAGDVQLIDNSSGSVTFVQGSIADILTDTAVIGAAGAGLTDLGGMSTGMLAEVNAEVDTALSTTTYAEPGAIPAATASIADKISFVCATARNKITQTATTSTLRNDADSGNIGTSTVSDDGTTATRGEWS